MSEYPPGWDEERVKHILEHYENQTDQEAVAEDDEVTEAMNNVIDGFGEYHTEPFRIEIVRRIFTRTEL